MPVGRYKRPSASGGSSKGKYQLPFNSKNNGSSVSWNGLPEGLYFLVYDFVNILAIFIEKSLFLPCMSDESNNIDSDIRPEILFWGGRDADCQLVKDYSRCFCSLPRRSFSSVCSAVYFPNYTLYE